VEQPLSISLLWPSESAKEKVEGTAGLEHQSYKDLGVERLVEEISFNYKYSEGIKQLLLQLCADRETIMYRLDIMEDFCSLPEMGAELESVLPLLHKLDEFHHARYMIDAEQLRKIAWQLEILSIYTEFVSTLNGILNRYREKMKSEGLHRLLQFTGQLIEDETFRSLTAELPDLRAKLQGVSSVTLRIHLNHELKPEQAVILSLDSKTEKKRSLLSRLLGMKSEADEYRGVSQYQSIVKQNSLALDSALLNSLEQVFSDSLLPIGAVLKRFIDVNTRPVTSLELEIGFYIGASRFIHKIMNAGMPMCKPEVVPAAERVCQVLDMFDPILAIGLIRQYPDIQLSNTIVTNDVEFGPKGTIYILTGPNQGGKTTYTRAIGLLQVLIQAGIYVPGRKAAISPADRIFTHFSEEEKPNLDHGRLGEESKRLHSIFMSATPQSLILLNESFSSTSHLDSYFLARDVVKGIKMLGCRTVYATHILELAAEADRMNEEEPGEGRLVSMVAGVDLEQTGDQDSIMAKRTYKVQQGPPNDRSFAKDIASLYGISFGQIVQTLKERKVIQ
jgi:hypothetical protein